MALVEVERVRPHVSLVTLNKPAKKNALGDILQRKEEQLDLAVPVQDRTAHRRSAGRRWSSCMACIDTAPGIIDKSRGYRHPASKSWISHQSYNSGRTRWMGPGYKRFLRLV